MSINRPDPVIARFLATLPAKDLGQIVGVNRDEYGITVGWVWMPDHVFMQWEGKPVFHCQYGKYAFSDHDELEPEPECDRPF